MHNSSCFSCSLNVYRSKTFNESKFIHLVKVHLFGVLCANIVCVLISLEGDPHTVYETITRVYYSLYTSHQLVAKFFSVPSFLSSLLVALANHHFSPDLALWFPYFSE